MLDLDDTLIHSDWTRGRGWRTFKRPGAEDFLRQVHCIHACMLGVPAFLSAWLWCCPFHNSDSQGVTNKLLGQG